MIWLIALFGMIAAGCAVGWYGERSLRVYFEGKAKEWEHTAGEIARGIQHAGTYSRVAMPLREPEPDVTYRYDDFGISRDIAPEEPDAE